jgi:hypothetical protein
MSSFTHIKTASSDVPLGDLILLVAVIGTLRSKVSTGTMLIRFFVLSSAKASVLLSSVTHGVSRNGLVLGRTDRKSGHPSGSKSFRLWDTLSEMTGNSSWSVSLPTFLRIPIYMTMVDKDFLSVWEQIDRTLLFDETWAMSSQWLQVTSRSYPSAWSYGDVSCKCLSMFLIDSDQELNVFHT